MCRNDNITVAYAFFLEKCGYHNFIDNYLLMPLMKAIFSLNVLFDNNDYSFAKVSDILNVTGLEALFIVC